MSGAKFDVVFRGVIAGFTRTQVQVALVKLFAQNPAKVVELFNAPSAYIKKNVSELEAKKFVKSLAAIGVRVEVVPVAQAQAAEKIEPTEASPRTVQPEVEAELSNQVVPGSLLGYASLSTNIPFVFSGQGADYFKIWIKNILLTIITLGVYSAWAKVQKQRYFYSHTHLDGNAFEYTANPIQILKGRLLVAAAVSVCIVLATFSPVSALVLSLLLLFALPWAVVKTLQLNASSSHYRQIQFSFQGSHAGAVRAFILWPLLSVLSIGLLIPIMLKKQIQYIIGNHVYGSTYFNFDVSVSEYYKIFGVIIAASVALLTALLLSVGDTFIYSMTRGFGSLTSIAILLSGLAFYLAATTYLVVTMTNLKWNNAWLHGNSFHAGWSHRGYGLMFCTNTLLSLLTLGLYIPFASIKVAAYKAKHTQFVAQGDLNEFIAMEIERKVALGEVNG